MKCKQCFKGSKINFIYQLLMHFKLNINYTFNSKKNAKLYCIQVYLNSFKVWFCVYSFEYSKKYHLRVYRTLYRI